MRVLPLCTEDTQFLEAGEAEDRTPMKPTFGNVIKDVEVVEGSAARFECTIEGMTVVELMEVTYLKRFIECSY